MTHNSGTTQRISHTLGEQHPVYPHLHRLIAGYDIPTQGVKAGDRGGWAERVENVNDEAWVSDNAQVCGNTWVGGNARVYDEACVSGPARVGGEI